MADQEPATGGWVALVTFNDEMGFREAGGVYPHAFISRDGYHFRELKPDEPVALCPRCNQRFAATEYWTAEANRDRHFNGDEEIPSICRKQADASAWFDEKGN